jgi:glycosyltransferase involved in cell wall biosynthesis
LKLLLVSLYFHPARRYGGPVASTWGLARGLAAEGVKVRVLTTDADGPQRLAVPPGWQRPAPHLEVRYARRRLSELVAPGWLVSLPREIARADGVHVSGLLVWALPYVAVLCRLLGKPLVISPRGMLMAEALGVKADKKAPFLALLRVLGVGRRAWFHATAESEAEAIAQAFPGARVTIVGNGVELPEPGEKRDRPPELPAGEFLLYLGRLHPFKGLDRILEAFAQAELGATRLVLAGTGEPAYRDALERDAQELGIADRVFFPGEVEGAGKAAWLTHAAGLVLASRSENFGVAVAEALAHGTPAVVTTSAPWEGLVSHRAGFWVAPEELAAGLRQLMALSGEERRAMGERGRAWVTATSGWPAVARSMMALYAEAFEEDPPVGSRRRTS